MTLPRIGVVRTHESTRKLARHVERGTGRIRSATVTRQGGRWFCSFSVQVDRHDPAPARPESVVGVDLGIKSLAVLSTGEVIANPRHLEIALKELRRLQRQAARRRGPDKRTRQQPSQRWRTTQARIAPAHRCRERPPRRPAQTVHPPGTRPRHDRDRRPQASPGC